MISISPLPPKSIQHIFPVFFFILMYLIRIDFFYYFSDRNMDTCKNCDPILDKVLEDLNILKESQFSCCQYLQHFLLHQLYKNQQIVCNCII